MSFAFIVSSVGSVYAEDCSTLFFNPVERLETYPLAQPHLSYSPATVYPEHCKRFSLLTSWASVETVRPGYYVDAEYRLLQPQIQVPLSAAWSVRSGVPLLWKGGGSLDGSIESFHDIFGFPQGGRDRRSDNGFRIDGQSQGEAFSFTDEGFGIGNWLTSLIYDSNPGAAGRFVFSGTLSLPTLKTEYGHHGIDAGVEVQYRYQWEQLFLFLGVQQAVISDRSVSGLSYHQSYTSVAGGSAYRFDDVPLLLTLQIYNRSSYTKGVPDHPDSEFLVDLVARTRLSESVQLSLGLQENPGAGVASTDVAGLMTLEYFWQ